MASSRTPHASLWLELVGGVAEFAHRQHVDQPQKPVDPSAENWWQGVFRLVSPDQLILSDQGATADMRFYLQLVSSLETKLIAELGLTQGLGHLRYVGNAEPPLAHGALLLAPNAFRSMVESIRSGRGHIMILLWSPDLGGPLSGEATLWDVKESSRAVIAGFDLKVQYGETGVVHRPKSA